MYQATAAPPARPSCHSTSSSACIISSDGTPSSDCDTRMRCRSLAPSIRVPRTADRLNMSHLSAAPAANEALDEVRRRRRLDFLS
jgi:hypothetical protein